MSDAVWLAFIGVAAMVVKEIFDDRRARRAELRADKVATELREEARLTKAHVAEVKTTLETTNSETRGTLDHIVKQTNGLVEKLGQAEFARGVKSETDKQGEKP